MSRRMRGAALVEFALVAGAFLLLLLAVIEFSILFWVDLTMQHAVREGARYAITGQSNLDPNTSNQQRYNAVVQEIRLNSMGLYDRLTPTIAVGINGGAMQSYGDASLYNPGMFGGPGDTVVLQLNCAWPIIAPMIRPFFASTDGEYRFSVAATMRNEAF